MKKAILLTVVTLVAATATARPAYVEPRDTMCRDTAMWSDFSTPVLFTWASKDVHYRQFDAPQDLTEVADTTVSAWRGERIGLEALVASTTTTAPLRVRLSSLRRDGRNYDTPGSSAGYLRYVMTTHWNACGYPPDTLPTFTVADMIDSPSVALPMEPRTVRPVWCTIEVPRSFEAGQYKASLELIDAATGKAVHTLGLTIDVSDRRLPAPEEYAFYLDLWQQPYAISRFYGVEPWSDEHFKLLEPYAEMLRRAGQKTVSTILFYEPWGEQSHDKFEPMVQTVRTRDGRWRYDYTILDKYVEFMGRHGIDANISCFTMIPWDMQFRYFDEATGQNKFLKTASDSPEYAELWTSFLQSLANHMKQRGWYDKTMIVMDERGLPDMLNARKVAQQAVPGIKMSLAGNYHSQLIDSLESYTLLKGDWFPQDVLKRRREKGFISLVYTCCANPAPNIFSNSAPADAAYLPVFATAAGFDGYLHWSFTNWADNPETDSRFRMFAPGDTYFVYPDGRTSVRYERMVEGIQLSEKIRLLRQEMIAENDAEGLALLDEALLPVRTGAMTDYYPTSTVVNNLERAIQQLSER